MLMSAQGKTIAPNSAKILLVLISVAVTLVTT